MEDDRKRRRGSVNFCGAMGEIWAIGWLFTIGFLGLHFWTGVLAIIIWPYYLGTYFAR